MRSLIMILTAVLLGSFSLNLPLLHVGEAGAVWTVAVGKDAPVVEFVVRAGKIAVYRQDRGHALLQEIPYGLTAYAELAPSELINFGDMNFDGYMAERDTIGTFLICQLRVTD